MNRAFRSRLAFAGVLWFVLLGARPAAGSPSAAKYVEQSFLGANAAHWFYFEFIRDFPTSYYEHTEILRVCSRRKSDGALVDSIVVSQVRHHRDPGSLRTLPNESRATGEFDLAEYLSKNAIHLASDTGVGSTVLADSTGFYIQGPQHRMTFLPSPGMFRHLPGWTKYDPPVVRGAHRVADSWNRDESGRPRAEEWYFVVDFGRPGSESNWGRFVIYARRSIPTKP